MNIGTPTFSSFLHGAIAIVIAGIAWAIGWLGVEWAAALCGIMFFYGREMKEYQRKREQGGDGKHNVLKLKDLNPLVWARRGQSDGFWDFAIPAACCILAAGGTRWLL